MANSEFNKKSMLGAGLLLLAALIWGSSFVAQDVGLDYLEPFTFNSLRSFIGCIALLPALLYERSSRPQSKRSDRASAKKELKLLLIGGLVCGIFLFTASMLQQYGIKYTGAGKAGFLTTLYIVIVPLLGLFKGNKISFTLWIGVVLAICGIYLLSASEYMSLSSGDISLLLCALFFSFHILAVDAYSPRVSGIALSCLQLLISGIISLIFAFIFDDFAHIELDTILKTWLPLLYAGVLSSGIAYTLQIIAQRHVSPSAAPVIMSMESVFAAVSGWLILGDSLNAREIFGCALVLCAVLLAQIPRKSDNIKLKVEN